MGFLETFAVLTLVTVFVFATLLVARDLAFNKE